MKRKKIMKVPSARLAIAFVQCVFFSSIIKKSSFSNDKSASRDHEALFYSCFYFLQSQFDEEKLPFSEKGEENEGGVGKKL